ncbi:MAG: hypothetical protein D6790_05485 [Caldilineae bacterium]|nr:MAG: hypothetical protein D6790_05485 [Caldilineae bacterium]
MRAFYLTYFRELTDLETRVEEGTLPIPGDRPGLGVSLNPDIWQRDDLHVQVSEGEGKAANVPAMGDPWSKPDVRL